MPSRGQHESSAEHAYFYTTCGWSRRLLSFCFHLRRARSVLSLFRALTERMLRGMYELPGGKVEFGDDNVLHAAARELAEETGLKATCFLFEISPVEYVLSCDASITPAALIRCNLQLNFVVQVHGSNDDVTLDPAEHDSFVWADEAAVDILEMTDGMR